MKANLEFKVFPHGSRVAFSGLGCDLANGKL